MPGKSAAQIRKEFLSYFEKNGHTVVESSGLIPQNDPTLLFTNAGMVQFKDVFLGSDPRPYKRATTSQKCVRAGGKHNDLERVGFTARHHTFFEMLGNFSFGDYFKKEAIHYAWDFVTNVLKLDKNRLYVTVHVSDDEAQGIWEKQESVPKERIFRFDADNFWAMGDTGPCGPCSEIFVDRGAQYSCGKPDCNVGCSCDRYMEIWNLVFMQYERSADGKMTPLPKPSIDTGMGLERVASVVQAVDSNYDTDLFQNLIRSIGDLARVPYGKSTESDVSLRVVADHCRATNFLIADGVLPSNEGRGYVLRRIMRRAIRHGQKLGFKEPFLYKITVSLINLMGDAYPELKDKKEYLETTIKLEEERFLTTLDKGLHLLEDEFSKAKGKIVSGAAAFKLYDTFGFPLDLTQVIAQERGFDVDEPGFQKCMEEQRSRSREHWKGSGEEAVGEVFKQLNQKRLTTQFLGYSSLEAKGRVLEIIEEGKVVERTSTGSFQIIVDRTPFYAESGGQVGDQGSVTAKGFQADVVDVQRPVGEFSVLFCENAQGQLKKGDMVDQKTEIRVRANTARNHTATHLLHHALRKFLGPHVKQAGSLVTPDLLRFDFTHSKALSEEEVAQVEDYINDRISISADVDVSEMDKEKALAKGAIAFFGDKYGAQVRVVSVGDYSVELCGGTHVRSTSDIQAFKITNESGIAAGVRRIVAVTGPAVYRQLREKERVIRRLMEQLKASAPDEIFSKLEKLQGSEKELRKALDVQARKAAEGDVAKWISSAEAISGGHLITALPVLSESDQPAKVLRDLVEAIRSKTQKTVVALGCFDTSKGQAMVVVGVTKDWIEKVKASDLIKTVAPMIDGSGGGKPELAQAGGKKNAVKAALDAIREALKKG